MIQLYILKINLFIIIGGKLLYHIVVAFAIHWQESTTGVHVFPILSLPSHLPPSPIPLEHPSAPALSALSHASNLDWWSVSHMIVYTLIFTAELFSNIWSETWSFNTCNWVWNQDQWDKQMKDFYLSEPLRVCSMQWCLMSDKKVRMRLLAIVIQVNECFSPSW